MAKYVSGAAGSLSAQIKGSRRLARTLKKAGADMSKLKESNLQAAKIVVPVAESTVPKLTGKLANSIRAGATASAGVVRAGNKNRVPYAGPIHWGWPKHHIKATTFLVDAARQTQPQWYQVYKLAIDKALAQVKGA